MKQTFQTEIEQEVTLDRSVGNLFEEFLSVKTDLQSLITGHNALSYLSMVQ